MRGAYVATPVVETPLVLPDGWPTNWPLPGPLPPGYNPNYSLDFVDPPTPTEVKVGEEITVRVTLRESESFPTIEPTGDPNRPLESPSPIIFYAVLATEPDEVIWATTEGWEYVAGGFWGAEIKVTFPLTSESVTDPPKILTLYASGTGFLGDIPFSEETETDMEITAERSILMLVGLTESGITGSPDSWIWSSRLYLDVFNESDVLESLIYWEVIAQDESPEPTLGGPTEYIGTLPDGITVTMEGSQIGVEILADDIDPTKRYKFRFRARVAAWSTENFCDVALAGSALAAIYASDEREEDELFCLLTSGEAPADRTEPYDNGAVEVGYLDFQLNREDSEDWSVFTITRSEGIFADAEVAVPEE